MLTTCRKQPPPHCCHVSLPRRHALSKCLEMSSLEHPYPAAWADDWCFVCVALFVGSFPCLDLTARADVTTVTSASQSQAQRRSKRHSAKHSSNKHSNICVRSIIALYFLLLTIATVDLIEATSASCLGPQKVNTLS